MPDRTRATDGRDQQEADRGYFAPLAPARYMRLTTFQRDGLPVSAAVHGLADGHRVYFRARNRSGTVQRLRHADAVQVTPCGVLGFCTYGPPLDAIARPLAGEEASAVAAELDRKHPARRRFPTRLRRRQAVYYELLADDAAGGQGAPSGGLPASLTARVHTSQGFTHADAATPTSLATVCAPSTPSRSGSPGYTQITTVSMALLAPRPAAAG